MGTEGRPRIALERAWFAYPGADWVLRDCSISVARGERILVRGGNGCGKSTLLRLLAGRLTPNRGCCVHHRHHCHCCALLPQEPAVGWDLPIRCRDVVACGWQPTVPWWRFRGGGRRAAVERALERVGLTEHADRSPAALSGGQRRRLVIARTLVQEAEVMLLDEPLSGLDRDARQGLAALLDDVTGGAGAALVVASHETADFPLAFDRDLHFRHGALVPTAEAHCEVVAAGG